jgi:hypothetical protein
MLSVTRPAPRIATPLRAVSDYPKREFFPLGPDLSGACWRTQPTADRRARRLDVRRIHTGASIKSSIGCRFFAMGSASPAELAAAMRISGGSDQIWITPEAPRERGMRHCRFADSAPGT